MISIPHITVRAVVVVIVW